MQTILLQKTARSLSIMLITTCALMTLTQPLSAGTWTQKKKGYYLKIASGYVKTSSEFDHLGNEKDILEDFNATFQNVSYEEFSAKIYFEYGLLSKLTLVGDLPFKAATTHRTEVSNYFDSGRRDTSYTNTGLGDFKIQFRYGILDGPVVFSLQPGVKIPLYKNEDQNEAPQLGTGHVDLDAGVLLGASFYPSPVYFSSEGGYRFRDDPLHDELYLNAEIGLSFVKSFFKLEFRGVKNTTTPPDIYGGPIQLPLPGGGGAVPLRLFGDQDYIKLVGEAMYRFGKSWGVSGEVIHTLAGKNIITGTMFQIGFVLER